jgi:hypothetical protein
MSGEAASCCCGSVSIDKLRLRCDMAPTKEAANQPQIERIGDPECHKDKRPMPGLKARLVETDGEVRCFHEQGDLRSSEHRRNSAAPHRNRRRRNGLHATTADEPQEKPQGDSAQNDPEHEFSEEHDNCGTRSRQYGTGYVDPSQETIRDTAFECWKHFVLRVLT